MKELSKMVSIALLSLFKAIDSAIHQFLHAVKQSKAMSFRDIALEGIEFCDVHLFLIHYVKSFIECFQAVLIAF